MSSRGIAVCNAFRNIAIDAEFDAKNAADRYLVKKNELKAADTHFIALRDAPDAHMDDARIEEAYAIACRARTEAKEAYDEAIFIAVHANAQLQKYKDTCIRYALPIDPCMIGR